MAQTADYYIILGVEPYATRAEIRASYLVLAKKYHPDVAQNKADAHEFFIEINKAYHTLYDPALRDTYDAKHGIPKTLRTQTPASAPTIEYGAKTKPLEPKATDVAPNRPSPPPINPTPAARPNTTQSTDDRMNQPGWNWKIPTQRSGGSSPTVTAVDPLISFRHQSPEPNIASLNASAPPQITLLAQAREAARHNQWALAEEMCLKHLESNTACAECLEMLGDICSSNGRTSEALRFFRRASKAAPPSAILQAKIDCLRAASSYREEPDEASDSAAAPTINAGSAKSQTPPRTGWFR